MNKKQAYKAGVKAFAQNPCGELELDALVASYREADKAGLSRYRDTATYPEFRRGYYHAYLDHRAKKQ